MNSLGRGKKVNEHDFLIFSGNDIFWLTASFHIVPLTFCKAFIFFLSLFVGESHVCKSDSTLTSPSLFERSLDFKVREEKMFNECTQNTNNNSIERREYMEPSLTIQRNGKIQLINSASSAISNKICRLIYLFWSAMNLIKLRRIRIIRPQRHGPSISLFFFGPSLRSLLKLKFYAAIEIIQPFFFSSPFSLSHYLQVLWMKTITANILRKQWNFIGHLSTGHNFHK